MFREKKERKREKDKGSERKGKMQILTNSSQQAASAERPQAHIL